MRPEQPTSDDATHPTRTRRRRLRDQVAFVWLFALLVVIGTHVWVSQATWLMIHLVLLGALSHSVLVWSEHFAHTLLRYTPDDQAKAGQAWRIALLAAGSLLVFIGYPASWWWVLAVGATLVAASVIWHCMHLAHVAKRALPSRFRVVIRYYVAAACLFPVGIALGATLAFGIPEPWFGRLLTAHIMVNVGGWIGLTVTGTLVTFWPTMVRAKMDDRAPRLAAQALPVFVGAVLLGATGSLAGVRVLAVAGLVAYFAGLLWWGRALWAPVARKGIREFAPASVGLALCWALVALCWVTWQVATGDGWAAASARFPLIGGVIAAGFGAQILIGALTYLIPSVIGGGPSVVRAGQSVLHRWTTFRIVVPNVALVLWLAPVPSWVKVASSAVGVVTLAMSLPILIRGAYTSARAARAKRADDEVSSAQVPTAWTARGLLAAGLTLAVAVAVGVAVDPGAAGFRSQSGGGNVVATGETTRVEVTVEGMSFVPSRVEVPVGNRLVVHLRNTGDDAHDLTIGGAHSGRLAPGEEAEVDAGVIGADIQGYCTVAGHKQMGMTFDVVATGADTEQHPSHTASTPTAVPPVTGATLPSAVDPKLPPRSDERVHRATFTVTEVPLEVAPGLWQTRWTFNGASVGPTLRGKVGDEFEITLVNEGSMGHSIDFHAGVLAPDEPMRTIQPGERLVYRFTAERAGIWMYHCSTMPMSTHIAAGMHGAVVIEPDGLDPVDHEYVMVQSELYLGNAAHSADDATEIDADKLAAETPDRVVFNGVAHQYAQHPLQVRAGERVRFWVLDAGPNRALSFHVVGGQFDTVWEEGRYLIRQGKSADGGVDGGAQVLPLLAAQGGFVELTFPEPGHYAFVNHIMLDAERGARGIVEVTS